MKPLNNALKCKINNLKYYIFKADYPDVAKELIQTLEKDGEINGLANTVQNITQERRLSVSS